jgi:3-hydroxybutyryl-CoA dehydrogenase
MEESVLVIGTGQMGPGIALSFALAGFDVILAGRRREGVEQAMGAMAASARVMIEDDLLTPEGWELARERVTGEVGFAAAAPRCTYVVEAVVEEMAAKRALLAELEALVSAETLLASTTSALSPTELQRGLARPERVIVTHYAQPAHLMPVIEVVPGGQTSSETVERACAVLRRCGIRPVRCRDVPGFLFSRLQSAMMREVLALVRDGVATVEDVEAILKLGYAARLPAMGPFEHADLAGLDLIASVANTVWPDLDCSRDASNSPLARLIEQGHLGMRTGRGFYDWTARDPAEFRRRRDREIIRRLKILREEEGA